MKDHIRGVPRAEKGENIDSCIVIDEERSREVFKYDKSRGNGSFDSQAELRAPLPPSRISAFRIARYAIYAQRARRSETLLLMLQHSK